MKLTPYQVANNLAALGHCERLGLQPNTTLDIHFHRGELANPSTNARGCLQQFIKSSRQWIERRGGQSATIWVLENRSGVGNDGIHAHVLMHVPELLLIRWHQLRRTWARKAGLKTTKAGVINFNPIQTPNDAKQKLAYMLKDAEPETLAIFEEFINPVTSKPWIHDHGKPSNAPINGLRTGVSRNINDKARRSYHYSR